MICKIRDTSITNLVRTRTRNDEDGNRRINRNGSLARMTLSKLFWIAIVLSSFAALGMLMRDQQRR